MIPKIIHQYWDGILPEYSLGQTVVNGVIGSCINSKFIKTLIQEICKFNIEKIKTVTNNSWLIFGPRLWTKIFFNLYCRDIILYPSWYFMPNHYNDNTNLLKIDGFIMNHQWKNYGRWGHIIHYSHNCLLKIVDRFKKIKDIK